MKVSCPACDSKYTIADEKVAGRKVKVRCKSCGGQILINGTIPPPPLDGNDDADTGTSAKSKSDRSSGGANRKQGADKSAASSSPRKDAAKSSPTSSKPKSAPIVDDGITWSVNVTETDERTLKTHEVVAGYLSGEFAGEVYVWHDGMGDWSAIADAPELAAAIAAAQDQPSGPSKSSPPAAPATKQKTLPAVGKGGKSTTVVTSATPAEPSKRTAARAAGAKRPQSAHDLFAAASAAGSETDVPVSTEDDDAHKKTGARNENSVLFSLDALKAGITAAPAQQTAAKASPGRKAPATPRRKLEDLMVGASPTLATGPAGGASLLNANQALLTAPAPPPPPPKPEPVAAVDSAATSAAAIIYAKEREKTKRMLIGVIAAIVAVGAIAGIAIGMTKNRQEPLLAQASAGVASATVAPAPTPSAAVEPTKAPEPVASEATPEASTAPATAAAPAGGQKTSSGSSASSKSSSSSTTGTSSKTDTKKDTPAKKDEPTGPVSSGVSSFNKSAAIQALSVAASQTSICKKPDGPTGSGKVQVTFATSGRATTANIVGGPFGGTAVGGCVSGVFKRAKVPPFAGDPVTVSKSFSITP